MRQDISEATAKYFLNIIKDPEKSQFVQSIQEVICAIEGQQYHPQPKNHTPFQKNKYQCKPAVYSMKGRMHQYSLT
jgi:hypothetical protein